MQLRVPPPMLIQPFVENSIEHGFLGAKYQGEINIKLSLQNKWFSCIIEDNGTGIKDCLLYTSPSPRDA